MLVRFTKNPPAAPGDTLDCVRADGSTASAHLPREGVLPRLAFQFVIETTFGWRDALFGAIARGRSFDEILPQLLAPRRKKNAPVSFLSAAALVETLRAEQWSGPAAHADFVAALDAHCRGLGAPTPEITAGELERVRVAVREFGAAWRPLAPGRCLERNFPE